LNVNGRLAVDTNAVIAYREANSDVCVIIDKAVQLFLPAIVLGELLYGAINSSKPEKNEHDIILFANDSILISIDEATICKGSLLPEKERKPYS